MPNTRPTKKQKPTFKGVGVGKPIFSYFSGQQPALVEVSLLAPMTTRWLSDRILKPQNVGGGNRISIPRPATTDTNNFQEWQLLNFVKYNNNKHWKILKFQYFINRNQVRVNHLKIWTLKNWFSIYDQILKFCNSLMFWTTKKTSARWLTKISINI